MWGLQITVGKLANTNKKKISLAASEPKFWGKRKVIRACQFCLHFCQANRSKRFQLCLDLFGCGSSSNYKLLKIKL